MKQYLMTVMTAVALGGLFSGCTKEMEGEGGNSAAFDIVQNYENAFINRFGQPAVTQTWGFGPAATRAVVDQPSVTEGEYTYNAQMALAWEGVDAAIASGTSESNFDFMGSYSLGMIPDGRINTTMFMEPLSPPTSLMSLSLLPQRLLWERRQNLV